MSAELSWDAPEDDGGAPVTHYIVEKRNLSRKAWQEVSETFKSLSSIGVTSMRKDEANASSWFSKENSYKEFKTVETTNYCRDMTRVLTLAFQS